SNVFLYTIPAAPLLQCRWCLKSFERSRNPVRIRPNAGAKLGKKLRRVVEIIQRNHLDGTVHVAVRDPDQTGGHSIPAELHDVGIGPGGPGGAADLDIDSASMGRLNEPLVHPRIDIGAAKDCRSLAEPDIA